MFSDEEKKAIESFKEENNKDLSRFDDFNSYTQFKVKRDKLIIDLIEKQQKEIEELEKNRKVSQNFAKIVATDYISKDKLKEILGIEEEIDTEKILSLLQTIVDENNRLEDIEDRKVQIEYNNVFNKGVKSVEDKIKAKIEELDKQEQDLQNSISDEEREEYSDASLSWELMDIHIRREVLQSLLEKE